MGEYTTSIAYVQKSKKWIAYVQNVQKTWKTLKNQIAYVQNVQKNMKNHEKLNSLHAKCAKKHDN